jgi:hypothetical protein
MPPALVRITGQNAENWTQRLSSSGVSRSSVDMNPPVSPPHMATPLAPMDSPSTRALAKPSKPHDVVGSPPHTIAAAEALPVQPDRTKRASRRPWRASSWAATWAAAMWYWVG